MKYYKVKKESDQKQVLGKTANGCLFANELLTENELHRKFKLSEQFTPIFIKRHFDIVSVSKNDTYLFFGVRKQCTNVLTLQNKKLS